MTDILWVGHEADSYILGAAANSENTNARDAAYERTGMRVSTNDSGGGALTSTPDWAARDEIWHRFNWQTSRNDIGVGTVMWAARNAAGVNMAQLVCTANGVAQFQVWNGAAYTNVGATLAFGVVVLRFDVHFKGGAAGKFEVWFGAPNAQNKIVDAAGDYSAAINIVRVYHAGIVHNIISIYVGDEIVQSTSTLSSTSEIKPPTSNGADLDGTGTWADVDEQVFSDVDIVTLGAAGQRQSFKAPARTTTQAIVTGVTVSCRAWYETGGPTQIKPYLTIGAVRYYGPTFALDLVGRGYQYTWGINPATGVLFTPAAANAATLEWGWEAVA